MTANRSDRSLELVSAAYGAAIKPERFDALLAAWDAWCDDHLGEAGAAFEPLSPTFEEALSASEMLTADAKPNLAIDATQAPMILLDASGVVIALNAAASSLVEAGNLDVAHLIGSRRRSDVDFGQRALGTYRCNGTAGGRCYLAVETSAADAVIAQHPSAAKVLILSLIDWDDRFAGDLNDRFGLSDAELRVARGLLEGRTAQEISGELDRSVATIRSHIKALLMKSGTRRQTELVQLLTILRQTSPRDAVASSDRAAAADYRLEDWTGPAGTLRVVRYGQGRPVLYFTTTSLPEETLAVRAAFANAGFDVIAPARPGFRGDARHGGDASQALLDDWLDQLVDAAVSDPIVIGNREGGILAAKAASRVIQGGGHIGGLVMISTGAPTLDIADFEDAPDTVKRSFLAARHAQTALVLGYHTAARIFRSGSFGRDKILEYFFRDSPLDAARMSEPRLRQAMMDNLEYCFRDPSQVARDVRDWGHDWSADLEVVAAQTPVVFAHGREHTFQSVERIEALSDRSETISLCAFGGAPQLMLYEQADAVVAEVGAALGL